VLTSIREIGKSPNSTISSVAFLITLLPFLALLFGAVFLGFRLYVLEQRRRRTMDRLFEMELAELAGLEGKMDLLAEKGQKGREQYKEEFEKAKENILRQVKPQYGKATEAAASGAAIAAAKKSDDDQKPAQQ
jgi:hypothetical protein